MEVNTKMNYIPSDRRISELSNAHKMLLHAVTISIVSGAWWEMLRNSFRASVSERSQCFVYRDGILEKKQLR
jgi:hypothetical protein